MKKTYNPFKMWGSYVSAIIFVLIFHTTLLFPTYSMVGIPYAEPTFKIYLINGFSILRTISFGFLIGWGIHSLFRRFRK